MENLTDTQKKNIFVKAFGLKKPKLCTRFMVHHVESKIILEAYSFSEKLLLNGVFYLHEPSN